MRTHLQHCFTHLGMLLRPLGLSVTLSLTWWWLFFPGINLGRKDETVLTNTLIPVLAAFHAILAAIVMNKVWEEFKTIRRCIRRKDKEGFRDSMHDRIPLTLHVLLGVMSFFIIVSVMMIEYESKWTGMFVVGTLTFMLVLYFEVAITLDNPAKAPWYTDKIPTEWLLPDPPPEQKTVTPT